MFITLIPAFIASGLITGMINLLTRSDVSSDIARHYPNVLGLLALFGSAVFAIMNILVGVTVARVFGGSQAMGGVMAAILSSPGLTQIRLFDEPLQPGRGGVMAVLLVVALMCWVEKVLHRHLPESIELIVNPLLTTQITASLAIVVLQPLGGAVVALLAGSFLPLALTIVTGKVAAYLAGWAAAIAAGFIFTWLIGFNDPEE